MFSEALNDYIKISDNDIINVIVCTNTEEIQDLANFALKPIEGLKRVYTLSLSVTEVKNLLQYPHIITSVDLDNSQLAI
ncbi:MAG: hypothetical protein MUE81_18015 [Thermoflexibacter sp.]|jgi:hypothetical protein|nr:hypothetical protein [Thermoflexibacter sp.]